MSASTQPLAPLMPRPANYRRIKDVVAVYATPLDKYGRLITGAAPVWTILPRWARELYRELSDLGGPEGKLWPSYDYIGTHLMKVTPERARQQIHALENWGFIEKRHRTKDHGWYDTNLYGLVDPLAPRQVIAVACRTYDRRQPIQVVQLSAQVGEVPAFRAMRRGERPQHVACAPAPVAAAGPGMRSPVIVPGSYRSIAEAEGLIDPRLQWEAWGRFRDRVADRSKRKITKRGAFWRGICRQMARELQEAAQEAAALAGDGQPEAVDLDGPGASEDDRRRWESQHYPQSVAKVTSLAHEEQLRRRQFIVTQAYRELMAGADPGKAAAAIFQMPQMHRYCRLSECPLTDVVDLVHQAYATLQPNGA